MTYILCRAILLFSDIFVWALVIRAICSWFARDQYSTVGKIYMALIRFTEPVVAPCRKALSRLNTGMFDFSVLLAMILVQAVARLLVNIILRIGI
jgi:YggT family protein